MNPCATCQRQQPDTAVSCHLCTDRAYRQLHDLADATPAARDVATGQTRRGTPTRGHTDGRIPLDLTAVARLDAVQNEITTWARAVAAERGHTPPTGGDPLEGAARWLTTQLDWLRHRSYVTEAYADIRAACAIVRAIAAGPTERRWLGQCGADRDDDTRCPADLYAHPDGRVATCRTCGTRHDARERRAWLDGQTAGQAYTARQISQAYPQIPEATIRNWARRGELTAELEPLPPGVEGPLWVHRDAAGRPRPRYVLNDVLTLAASKAVARAMREARNLPSGQPTTAA